MVNVLVAYRLEQERWAQPKLQLSIPARRSPPRECYSDGVGDFLTVLDA